jgi:WD40 repeat protein
MVQMTNENILTSVFNELSLFESKKILDIIMNTTIVKVLHFRVLSYAKIYKSMGRTKTTLEGHTDIINSLAILPNGNIASASWDKKIIVWDLTYNYYSKLIGHNSSVNSLIILGNGNIASCSLEGQIKIWNTDESFECIQTIQVEGYKHFQKLLLLANGNLAVCAFHKKVPCILILDSQKEYKCSFVLEGHTNWINAIINLSGYRFATGSHDETIKIWDYKLDYSCINTILCKDESFMSLVYIERDNVLISGSYKNIKLWDMDSYMCIKTVEAHEGRINCLLLLHGGYLVTGSSDSKIKIWNMVNFECINVIEGHDEKVKSLAILKDYRIVSASEDRMIILMNY